MGAHDDEAISSRSKCFKQYKTVKEAMLLRTHLLTICCGEAIDKKLTIKLFVASINEEIFTSKAWTNAFNIGEPVYSELCYEFYSTYKFDDVCADDELRTKKIIKFSDDHFNAQEYWLSISREENLSLSRSHASIIRKPILRVLHKMITYGLCQRKTGALDTTTLRQLINSGCRLIPKAPRPGVPRVAIPIPSRAAMQDFSLGRHLEEIHVTLALFWKKQDKSTTLHKRILKNYSQKVKMVSGILATPSGLSSNRVREFVTASGL
nr:hypothetical protein [Tanacetum cinerariifolium]